VSTSVFIRSASHIALFLLPILGAPGLRAQRFHEVMVQVYDASGVRLDNVTVEAEPLFRGVRTTTDAWDGDGRS
jgi:hypothetical protein